MDIIQFQVSGSFLFIQIKHTKWNQWQIILCRYFIFSTKMETSKNKSCVIVVFSSSSSNKLQKFVHSVNVFWITISHIIQLLTLKFMIALDLTVVRMRWWVFAVFYWNNRREPLKQFRWIIIMLLIKWK